MATNEVGDNTPSTPESMAADEDIPPLSPDAIATCLEPSQHLYRTIVGNPRPGEKWTYVRTETPRNTEECDRTLKLIKDGIEFFRSAGAFVPAYKFLLDYLPGDTHEELVIDILGLQPTVDEEDDIPDARVFLGARLFDRSTIDDQVADILGEPVMLEDRFAVEGKLVPVYFKCLFKASVKTLLDSKFVIHSMDIKINGVLRFLQSTINQYEKATDSYRRSVSFLSMSARDRRNYSRETKKAIDDYRSMISKCEETFKIKSNLISWSSDAFAEARRNLPRKVSRDNAIKILKVRDFVYHFLDLYAEYLLETFWRIKLACREIITMEERVD